MKTLEALLRWFKYNKLRGMAIIFGIVVILIGIAHFKSHNGGITIFISLVIMAFVVKEEIRKYAIKFKAYYKGL